MFSFFILISVFLLDLQNKETSSKFLSPLQILPPQPGWVCNSIHTASPCWFWSGYAYSCGGSWLIFVGFVQDYCDAELCIHRRKLRFTNAWLCYEQLDPCFHFLACCCFQVNTGRDWCLFFIQSWIWVSLNKSFVILTLKFPIKIMVTSSLSDTMYINIFAFYCYLAVLSLLLIQGTQQQKYKTLLFNSSIFSRTKHRVNGYG